MKRATIIPVMALFLMILASCNLFPDLNPKENDLNTLLEEGYFYAKNMTYNSFYKVKAEMLYAGEKCEIWAETGSGITRNDARTIAGEYDTVIRPRIVEVFSEKDFTYDGEEHSFDDMLDFANWLAGRDDGKLTILLLDIKDDFERGKNEAYVAGYFYSGNFWPAGKIDNSNYSNGRDMIYVDINPGWKERREQSLSTFAHELQHLVNYVTGFWLDKNYTDTWIDEGLSTYAEYLYLGENPADRCDWLSDSRNTIKTGNNFFVWNNHGHNNKCPPNCNDPEHNPYAVLDDYATVYLFFRWLYLQADTELQSHIFRDIACSSFPDYRAVTSVASRINSAWGSWEALLRTWLAANYSPKNTTYGYKGDAYLQEAVKANPVAGNTIPLYPGEGVYSIINNFYSAASADNIRYAGLAGTIDTSSPYSGNVLLTFNANTNKSASPETGSLTGVPSSITVSPTAADDARSAGKRTGPYVIDARDVLGRDKDEPKFRLPR